VVSNQAWQVAGSWVITGERPTYNGVKPKTPFAPGTGGWGAWELAARFGQLLIDQEVFEGDRFAVSATQPSTVHTWAVGLNWYPTRFLKWQTAYEETIYDAVSGTTAEAREREHFLITRLSLFF
jgi:phosphate-selective porin OprO and OprP